MTPDLVTSSGEFVMYKSIKILETEVTRVGSLINWLRLYTSKMFLRKEEMRAFASRNTLHLKYIQFLVFGVNFGNNVLKLHKRSG